MSPTNRRGRSAGINDDSQAPRAHRSRSASPRRRTNQSRNRDELRSQLPSLNTTFNGPAPSNRVRMAQTQAVRPPATQAEQSLTEWSVTHTYSPPPSSSMMKSWQFKTGEWQEKKAAQRERYKIYEREFEREEREERRERRRQARERKRQSEAEQRTQQVSEDLRRHRNASTQAASLYPSDANRFTRPLLEGATAGQRPLNDPLDDPFVESRGDLHTLGPSVDFTTPTGQHHGGQAGHQHEREDTPDSEDIDYGSDSDPEDDESDHMRPGFEPKSRRVGNLPVNSAVPETPDVNPGTVRRTIERGRDPMRALVAQQEDHDRSTRRLRNELIEANNRVGLLQQQLRTSEGLTEYLENAMTDFNIIPTTSTLRQAGATPVHLARIQLLESQVADQRRRAENAEGDRQQRLNALNIQNARIREQDQIIYDQARHIRRQAEEIADVREYARLPPGVNVLPLQNRPQEPRRQQPQRPPRRRNTQGIRPRQPRCEPRQTGPRRPQRDAQPPRPPPAGERRQPARAAKSKVKSYAPSRR
ncbi:MAG: hypothetical protein Q9174_000794 [Haloplaca sp. 1 TL-2023]